MILAEVLLTWALFAAADGNPIENQSEITEDSFQPKEVIETTELISADENIEIPFSHPVKLPVYPNVNRATNRLPKGRFYSKESSAIQVASSAAILEPFESTESVSSNTEVMGGEPDSSRPDQQHYQTQCKEAPTTDTKDLNLGVKDALGLVSLPRPDNECSQFSKIVELHKVGQGQVSFQSSILTQKSKGTTQTPIYLMASHEYAIPLKDIDKPGSCSHEIWMVPAHSAKGARSNNFCLKLLFDSATPDGPLPHITGAVLTPISKNSVGEAPEAPHLVFEVVDRNSDDAGLSAAQPASGVETPLQLS